jgi:hypothetical protein
VKTFSFAFGNVAKARRFASVINNLLPPKKKSLQKRRARYILLKRFGIAPERRECFALAQNGFFVSTKLISCHPKNYDYSG